MWYFHIERNKQTNKVIKYQHTATNLGYASRDKNATFINIILELLVCKIMTSSPCFAQHQVKRWCFFCSYASDGRLFSNKLCSLRFSECLLFSCVVIFQNSVFILSQMINRHCSLHGGVFCTYSPQTWKFYLVLDTNFLCCFRCKFKFSHILF